MFSRKVLSSLLPAVGLFVVTHAFASMRSNPDAFFKPAPGIPESLSADQFYPGGKMFPFSFFSVGGGTEEKINELYPEEIVQREFARYKKLGVPTFGPQYELNDRALADAEKHDLKVIYTVGIKMGFHDKSGEGKGPLKLTAEEIYEQVSAQVKAAADNRRIVLWYLRPEELRPWRKPEMAYLEAVSKAVRENDPLKRPVWIYDPAHASAKRMSSIAPWVDYIGKGMYPNYVSQKDSRVYCRWTIEQEIEAIRLAGTKGVPIAVPEMFRQPAEEELAKIPTWVKHDVFQSLISGAKGVIVFSARHRPNFPAYDTYYNAYADVAKALLGPKKLGDVFLFGEKRQDLQVDVTAGPAEVDFLYPSGGVKEPVKYPSLNHFDGVLGNDRYLFVVNSANEPVTASIGGMPYNAVRVVSLLDEGKPFDVAEGEFEYQFAPLEVKAFKLERR